MNQRLLVLLPLLSLACTGKYIRPTTDEVVQRTPQRLERGEYIVNNLASCGACHTTREGGDLMKPESTTQFLGGGNVMEDESVGFRVGVPNITNDDETGLGRWTDDQIMRSIRDCVSADGHLVSPLMPCGSYRFMSDEDVRAVTAYLRSVPKVKQTVPNQPLQAPFFIKWAFGLGVGHYEPAHDVPPPPANDKVKLGAYLVNLGHCDSCHSMGQFGPKAPGEEGYLGGSAIPFFTKGYGKIYSRNLTSDETGLGKYTDEQIKQALMQGTRLDGKPLGPPMSMFMPHISGMKPEDMDALVAYLRSVKPVKHVTPPRELTPEAKKLLGGE